MAELDVLGTVTTRRFMMGAQLAARCLLVETEELLYASQTLLPSLADVRPLLSRSSSQLPDREFAGLRVGHACVNAIGVCDTDLKRWETSTTGWGCSSPHFIRCGVDGDVWQPTDIRGLCRKLRRGFSVPKSQSQSGGPLRSG